MNNPTNTEIAKLTHAAIKHVVANGVDAFKYLPERTPTNGICAAINRYIDQHADNNNSYGYHFMQSFIEDALLYTDGLGVSGELNDLRLDVILVLDQLSLADLEFFVNDSRKYW